MDLAANIAAQRARIARLEQALWRDGLDPAMLEPYQQAFRELESLLARRGQDTRHHFVVVIPVADSPQQLRNCLDSLLAQCAGYAYGGSVQGRWHKVSVLLADDSADAQNIARNRRIAEDVTAAGVAVDYFGLEQQLALLDRVRDIDLGGIIGDHPRNAFGRKGQGMMRNIAYLRLAELQAGLPGERLLFYTIDADQEFSVKVATPDGEGTVAAINYFYHLDRLFAAADIQVLTGKVVGDPPVSPAVMAGNFLEDAIALVEEMAGRDPSAAYPQPAADPRGSGEAVYHDMADLFGFARRVPAYRYRCALPGRPSNLDCFNDFAAHLNSFLHGEHPTRVTLYRYAAVADSVQPARTVYTGNYVFTARALDRFIPFAPLRLRMSGPTMGRLLRAELGGAFVSANVPMLHRRTLRGTGESEYRPGIVSTSDAVDLADEYERQFFGDVMLFSMERLTAAGYPGREISGQEIGAVLDTLYQEMLERYRDRQQAVLGHVVRLQALLGDPGAWWQREAAAGPLLQRFARFIGNIERNFGVGSDAPARIVDAGVWQRWRARQLAAIGRLASDRHAWRHAMAALPDRRTR